MKTGLRGLIGACVLLMLCAAGVQAKECRDAAIAATSREYVSRSLGAFPGSWAAWRNKVKADVGDGWQAWRRAEEREIKCEQITNAQGLKRWVCTRTARPCRPGNGDASAGGGGGSSSAGNGEPPNDLPAIDQILRRGMQGKQVETLQYLLREAGYNLKLDGDFGRSTEDAVRDFQRKNKLKVDGRAGPDTVEALTS